MADIHPATIARDVVLTLCALAGGIWAWWRWCYEERLRRFRDFPAIDGEISGAAFEVDGDKSLVQVSVTWRNRGKLPVNIDCSKTSILVREIDKDVPPGPIELGFLDDTCLHRFYPLRHRRQYILEPGTESLITQFVVLLYFPAECICHAARLSSLSAAA